MLMAAMLLMASEISAKSEKLPRKQLLNDQWQFVQNDSNFTKAHAVTLPHDWSILQRFDANAPTGNDGAYLPAGKGWYRRQLTLGKAYEAQESAPLLRGCLYELPRLCQRSAGWRLALWILAFWVDATPYIKIGQNEIVVSVDNSQQKNCRWYSGSGIYRKVL